MGSTQLKLPDSSSELGLGLLLALILIFRPNGLSGGKELTWINPGKGAKPETANATAGEAPSRATSNVVA